MNLSVLKQEVYEANMELVKQGLVILTWGNVSAIDRANGLIVIKPRGIDYALLTPEDMSVVDLAGRILEGSLLPSVDLDIHIELYKTFEKIGGIAHTHSTWATAWCQAGKAIPIIGTTHADHFFGQIPCTRVLSKDETENNYEKNLGKAICELFTNKDPLDVGAALVINHGPFSWGIDTKTAVEHSIILEEVAKMAKLSLDIVNEKDIYFPDYLGKKHFTRKYGKNAYFYQSK